jgi:hypothetical protein
MPELLPGIDGKPQISQKHFFSLSSFNTQKFHLSAVFQRLTSRCQLPDAPK